MIEENGCPRTLPTLDVPVHLHYPRTFRAHSIDTVPPENFIREKIFFYVNSGRDWLQLMHIALRCTVVITTILQLFPCTNDNPLTGTAGCNPQQIHLAEEREDPARDTQNKGRHVIPRLASPRKG